MWWLLLAGCGTSFDPTSFINKPRVLAIHAEPPEAAPGQSSTLNAFIVGEGSDGGTPALSWTVCTRAPATGSGQAVNPDCLAAGPADQLVPVGDGPLASVTMPPGSPFDRGLPDATFGFYLPVILRAGELTAVYRLRETVINPLSGEPAQPVNHNPKLDHIYVVPPGPDAGPADLMELDPAAPPEVHKNDKITLRATVTPDSFERYKIIVGDLRDMNTMDVTELQKISWFSTAGTFSEDVTGQRADGQDKPDTTLRLDEKHTPAAPATIEIYVVVRDDRGGVDFTTRTLLLR